MHDSICRMRDAGQVYHVSRIPDQDFLKDMKLWHYSVVLDVGSYSLKLIQACYKGGRFYLRRYAIAEASGLVSPSFLKPNVADEEGFKGLIKDLFRRTGVRAREIFLLIPDLSLKFRFLEFQEVSGNREEIKELAKWRIRELLPFPAEEAVLDYQEIPDGSRRLLCLIGRRDVIAQYERLVEETGHQARVLESNSLSLYNFWEESLIAKQEKVCLLNLGYGEGTFIAVERGYPRFIRSFGLDGALREKGSSEGSSIGPYIEGVAREVSNSLSFLAEEGEYKAERLFLAGEASSIENLDLLLTDELGLSVEGLDPTGIVSYSSSLKLDRDRLSSLSPALGAATRGDM